MIILGIDPSINSTGLCIYDTETDSCTYHVIPSKMTKKMHQYNIYMPYEKIVPPANAEYTEKEHIKTSNLQKIVSIISDILDHQRPELVIIEGVSYGSKGSAALVDLAGLNFMIRALVLQHEIPFIIVSPTEWKKQMIGNGSAEKDTIIESWRRLEPEMTKLTGIKADDIADAYFLAHYGAIVKPGLE